MKKFATLIAALALSATTLFVEAAPRAAEDPTATVISTTTGAPKVWAAKPAKGKKSAMAKQSHKKSAAKKKAGKKSHKGKKVH